jgi:hypothetical protein
LGKDRVTAVVTDNASCMRTAWALIEKHYPHIFANGCAAHVLNLLVKDILGIGSFKGTLQDAVAVTNLVKARGALSDEFRKIQKPTSKARFLTLPVETRWYTQYRCVANVVDNQEILEQLAATTRVMENYKSDRN